MKRLLFSLPYGVGFRNVVCCGIVDACIARGVAATVLVPDLSPADAERVRRELPAGVAVRRLMPAQHSFFVTYLKLAKQHFYARRTALDSFRVKYDRRRRLRPVFHLAAAAVERLSEIFLSERVVDRMLGTARQRHEAYYDRLLDELKTDVVVLTKPGYHPEDLALIRAARRRNVPTISIDTTWDNMASKRPPYLRPDALTVWNEPMRLDAVNHYGFEGSRVAVTGGAAFDVFFRPERLPTKRDFLTSIQLDPARQLIVFTLNNPIFTPDNAKYIEFLLDAIRGGTIGGGPNLVVRMHPWDRESDYEPVVRSHSAVRLERSFGAADPTSVYECIPTRQEVDYYGALMLHADVVVNIGSTTSLDALAAGAPIVNIAFDVTDTPPELSAARFYDYSHYKPIVESGAVRVTYDAGAFFAAVNAYLNDGALDMAQRATARDWFMTHTDGGSAERVAATICHYA